MILIAHRGLSSGPDANMENTIDAIRRSFDLGFDVELDIWFDKDRFWLGHDSPTYEFNLPTEYVAKYWFHAKNKDALHKLIQYSYRVFWHEGDDYTLTSWNDIWAYPGVNSQNAISVITTAPNKDRDYPFINNCRGICSKWIEHYQNR